MYLDPPAVLALSERVAEQAAAQIAKSVEIIFQSTTAHKEDSNYNKYIKQETHDSDK